MSIKRAFKKSTNLLSDRTYVWLNYIRVLHRIPNLRNPKTFSEKMQWLKLYNHRPEYCEMVDKLAMREFVKSRIGDGYTVPLLGQWNSFEDIDFSALPDKFVIKCNHDSGGLVVCDDRKKLDFEDACKRIGDSLRTNYYYQNREWVYRDIRPKVFAEEYIQDDTDGILLDYKFFCFNGVPKIMYMARDGAKVRHAAFFDMEGKFLDIEMDDPKASEAPELPSCFDEMKRIAGILSKDVPFLRVDFFYVNGHIYVGELTFFHCGGFTPVKPESWNLRLGSWIELPKEKII